PGLRAARSADVRFPDSCGVEGASPVTASLERAAALLETAARELRELAGSSRTPLAPPRGVEAECDVPGMEPEAAMTPPTTIETTEPTTTELPMLMTRAEVVGLLRIHPRTCG